MRNALIVAVAVSSLAAGPASQPSTQPADVAIAASQVESAQRLVVAEVSRRRTACEATDAYKTAAAEMAARLADLEKARKTGSTQDRLNASSAYGTARHKVEGILQAYPHSPTEAKAVEALKQAQSGLKIAEEKTEQQIATAQKAENDRKRQKIVTKGMTTAEVEAMWGKPTTTSSRADGTVTCHYEYYEMRDEEHEGPFHAEAVDLQRMAIPPSSQVRTLIRTLDVAYQNGKVSDFEDLKIK